MLHIHCHVAFLPLPLPFRPSVPRLAHLQNPHFFIPHYHHPQPPPTFFLQPPSSPPSSSLLPLPLPLPLRNCQPRTLPLPPLPPPPILRPSALIDLPRSAHFSQPLPRYPTSLVISLSSIAFLPPNFFHISLVRLVLHPFPFSSFPLLSVSISPYPRLHRLFSLDKHRRCPLSFNFCTKIYPNIPPPVRSTPHSVSRLSSYTSQPPPFPFSLTPAAFVIVTLHHLIPPAVRQPDTSLPHFVTESAPLSFLSPPSRVVYSYFFFLCCSFTVIPYTCLFCFPNRSPPLRPSNFVPPIFLQSSSFFCPFAW